VLIRGEALASFGLPDEDGDIIPDVLEVPELGAAAAEVESEVRGVVHTGLSASGCSIGTSDQKEPLDSMLALLAAIAAMSAFRRREVRAAD
jgi:hypothetical protein